MPYTIDDHKHIAAAWGAATGARASKLCRFPVSTGRQILEECGFLPQFGVTDLPLPSDIDSVHAKWRDIVIEKAAQKSLAFTHGIAAKLINSYFKDRFVCGGFHVHERVAGLHPPVDALLLDGLAKADFAGQAARWSYFRDKRWSKFDSATYQAVIDLIRNSLPPGAPMWTIEQYWRGHQ